ncbi:MAG: manganese efflux pump [Fusobacterium sp.]|nr:manganese efflux pump [Fusobacterium sp.]
MTLIEMIFLSIALGMDCLVVSFSQGLLIRFKRRKISHLLALIMGLFQGGMPLIGYFLTGMVYDYVAPFAKTLVFGIFMFLGGKFIIEAFQNEDKIQHTRLGYRVFILLGIATSIDALGAGISLKLTETPLLISCGIIAIGSYLMSLAGFWGGCFLKKFNTKFLEIGAGVILILLALKALV